MKLFFKVKKGVGGNEKETTMVWVEFSIGSSSRAVFLYESNLNNNIINYYYNPHENNHDNNNRGHLNNYNYHSHHDHPRGQYADIRRYIHDAQQCQHIE